MADELLDHPQLVVREKRRLDASEDQPSVGEQLLPRPREASCQLIGALHVQPHELVLRRPLQGHDPNVRIIRHRAADKLHLESRLAFEIEDLLPTIRHEDQRFALVVLRDDLVGLRGDAEPIRPRPSLLGREAHAHARRPIAGKPNVLRGDDPTVVLHIHTDGALTVSPLPHREVDRQARPLQHPARCLHPAELDVSLEPLPAHPHRVDRHRIRLQRQHRLRQRLARVVGAIRHQHQTGQWYCPQLAPRHIQSLAQIGLAAAG